VANLSQKTPANETPYGIGLPVGSDYLWERALSAIKLQITNNLAVLAKAQSNHPPTACKGVCLDLVDTQTASARR
jgi:hypothetical protein